MQAPKTVVALVAAFVAGVMVGVQSRINGDLAVRTHSALEAAMASFLVGLVLTGAILAVRPAGARRLLRARVQPWWWFGGLGGALAVAATAHGVPEIGVALVTVCIVAGNSAGAAFSDQLGLGPGGRHPLSRWRLAGIAVVIAAVTIGAVGDRSASLKPLLFLVIFLGGATSAVQQAANGQLRLAAHDVVVASFVSFLGGAIGLVVVTAAAGELSLHEWPAAPWLYLGGPLGACYVFAGATTVRVLGVLRFVLAALSGQLLCAVVIDAVWPSPGTHLRATTVIGAIVTVVGVWLSGLGRSGDVAPEVVR
ncbi:MAG TPA: DMT family transporter [Mycobacteriales bacterium]|nr:DMT family transporter [Mycobacteriales bacterium]